MKKRLSLVFYIFILLLYSLTSSHSEDKRVGLDEAISIALKIAPGNIIKAKLEKDSYEIKIRRFDGDTEKIEIDAWTGRILKRNIKSSDKGRHSKFPFKEE